MRLNPHLHVVFLDGAYHEDGTELAWNELGGQTNARTDTCAHGTPMRPVARSAPPGPRSFDPGPSHHDARGPTLSVCCATLPRAAIRLLLPTRQQLSDDAGACPDRGLPDRLSRAPRPHRGGSSGALRP
ncbi:hypothetical protein [Sorangium sp. So ce260]|uniref:hypothetical protein n=1 Tax=Sorangium sp. So ce260 TaxID=3133291 RepID=UPI003F632ED8